MPAGIDSAVAFLLHMDGADASTTFTDSGPDVLTVTTFGDAEIDTAQSKFGGASGLFSGAGHVEIADDPSLEIGSADFTFDFWVRRASITRQTIFSKIASGGGGSSANKSILCEFQADDTFILEINGGAVDVTSTSTFTSTTAWNHFMIARFGNTARLFVNGTQEDSMNMISVSVNDTSYPYSIGRAGPDGASTPRYFDGWIDEFRFSLGIARPSSLPFKVRTAAYTEDGGVDDDCYLMLHCNGTDTSTDFPDYSKRHHIVTANGDAEVDTAAKQFGTGSLECTSTGYLSLPDRDEFETEDWDFTFDFWVKVDSTTNAMMFAGQTDPGDSAFSHGWMIGMNAGGQVYARMYYPFGSFIEVNSSTIDITTAWTHVAVERNQWYLTLYFDGVLMNRTSANGFTGQISNADWNIGRKANGTLYLAGQIDEFRYSWKNARYLEQFPVEVAEYAGGAATLAPAEHPSAYTVSLPPVPLHRYAKKKTNPGWFDIPLDFSGGTPPAETITIDKWENIKHRPFRDVKRNIQSQFSLVELITVPPIVPPAGEILAAVFQNLANPKKRFVRRNRPSAFSFLTLPTAPPEVITIDKWENIKNNPVRKVKRNKANVTQNNLVEFNVPTQPVPLIDKWEHIKNFPFREAKRKRQSHFSFVKAPVVAAETITIDKWENIKNYPFRDVKRNKANKSHAALVEFNVPAAEVITIDKWENIKNPQFKSPIQGRVWQSQFSLVQFNVPPPEVITIDKWYKQSPVPRRKKILNRTNLFDVDYIAAIRGAGGNYFDSGVYGLEITVTNEEAQTYLDETAFDFEITVTSDEDFQLEDVEPISFVIAYPDTGVEAFNSFVPGFISTTVMIDGVNESTMIHGAVNVIREDNTAARFTLNLNFADVTPAKKPVELINKVVTINFSAADMSGIIADYIPVFIGKIKHVSYNADIKAYTVSGYDYGGIHQTKGEFVSDNVTGVLVGQIYASSAQTYDTGSFPIWGVLFNGSDEVIDGTDYFVDTLNGTITVPISSRIIEFPGFFTYNYMDPFDSMKSIIQNVATIKGWELDEDNVTIADYTGAAEHPVLSLSDESVIDVCRKFLECSGAKVETNLYPKLRVYSEVENFVNPVRTFTVDESMIFENSLIFNINFDDMLNEQTVRSVQKVNSAITIGGLEEFASFEGSTGTLNPLAVQDPPPLDFWDIDLNMEVVLVEHRINKQGIQSISLSTSGLFYAYGLGGYWQSTITSGSWTQFTDGDDYVFQLKHRPVSFAIPGTVMRAYPATEYTLTVNGTKISYGDEEMEDVKIVTAQRPIGGISETLKGDVYENAYIETDTHCANICNAILLEYGNPYTAQFEIPLFEAKAAQIGDKIIIQNNSSTMFTGIIKMLNYNVNTHTGENRISVVARGVGVGI